jgi:hypothetical protein
MCLFAARAGTAGPLFYVTNAAGTPQWGTWALTDSYVQDTAWGHSRADSVVDLSTGEIKLKVQTISCEIEYQAAATGEPDTPEIGDHGAAARRRRDHAGCRAVLHGSPDPLLHATAPALGQTNTALIVDMVLNEGVLAELAGPAEEPQPRDLSQPPMSLAPVSGENLRASTSWVSTVNPESSFCRRAISCRAVTSCNATRGLRTSETTPG